MEEQRDLEVDMVLENTTPVKSETIQGLEVFCFYPGKFPDVKGIIFPEDEVIHLHTLYDVIINKIIKKSQGRLLFCNPYHEFEVDDIINVRISKISSNGNPKFELYGYVGYVNNEHLNVGDNVHVQIKLIKPTPNYKHHVLETILRL